jgi:hypothetical protein
MSHPALFLFPLLLLFALLLIVFVQHGEHVSRIHLHLRAWAWHLVSLHHPQAVDFGSAWTPGRECATDRPFPPRCIPHRTAHSAAHLGSALRHWRWVVSLGRLRVPAACMPTELTGQKRCVDGSATNVPFVRRWSDEPERSIAAYGEAREEVVGHVGMRANGHAHKPSGCRSASERPVHPLRCAAASHGLGVAAPPSRDTGVQSRDASTARMRVYDWVRVVAMPYKAPKGRRQSGPTP